MKRLFPALIFALGTVANAQGSPIDIATARLYFAEARQLGEADRGKLWGRPVAGPMLFVDPATGFIVANGPDREGKFEARDGVWTGKLPEGKSAANTGIDIGGTRWAMITWPVSDNRYSRRKLLMHESFHRIQDSIGIPGNDPTNAHLGSADGRIWLRLEMRALAEAMIRPGAARKAALTDALTFRAKRYELFPHVVDDERALELGEGLAEYTGLMLSGLPVSVIGDRIAVQLAQQETQESQSRSFAYATGPAYAFLLDLSGVSWRGMIKASSALASHVVAAYKILDIRGSDAESIVARYSGERMIALERARETNRIAKEKELRARFVDGPSLTLPLAGRFNFSFDPNGAVPIAGLGTVYESSKVSDEWGSLDVKSGGVLIKRNDKGLITGIVVAQPTMNDRLISGEGWTLNLLPGWSASESTMKPGQLVLTRH